MDKKSDVIIFFFIENLIINKQCINKEWTIENLIIACDPVNDTIILDSADASILRHTAENLDTLFENIYTRWGISIIFISSSIF